MLSLASAYQYVRMWYRPYSAMAVEIVRRNKNIFAPLLYRYLSTRLCPIDRPSYSCVIKLFSSSHCQSGSAPTTATSLCGNKMSASFCVPEVAPYQYEEWLLTPVWIQHSDILSGSDFQLHRPSASVAINLPYGRVILSWTEYEEPNKTMITIWF